MEFLGASSATASASAITQAERLPANRQCASGRTFLGGQSALDTARRRCPTIPWAARQISAVSNFSGKAAYGARAQRAPLYTAPVVVTGKYRLAELSRKSFVRK